MKKIVDVIRTESNGNTRYAVILDSKLEYEYEEIEPNFFRAYDSGFYTALRYDARSTDAFAGSRFNIKMKGGGYRECDGDHWHVACRVENIISVGVSTLEDLKRCYVFSSGAMDRNILDEWLSKNEPKTEYEWYRNYPNYAEVLESRKKWRDEGGFFHHAEANSNIDRTHSLMKIEKELKDTTDRVGYRNETVKKQSELIEKLLVLLREDQDLGDNEGISDYLLENGIKADVWDYIEEYDEGSHGYFVY